MSKLFRNDAKGEVIDLRNQLDSNNSDTRKKAAKRVVALMRAGENVGNLFSSMLRCVKTDDLELKRLTYLYFVTYAEEQSEEAIMAVNTFIQDSEDRNPLVRALAVRTMSRIRIDTIAEHMIIPIKQRLSDKDPFVRKTAVLAIAKLFEIIPESVENSGVFSILIKLLKDENPLVVSNSAAAICEINSKRSSPIYEFNDDLTPIINAIVDSAEWCQITLLNVLSQYEPKNPDEAQMLIQRFLPFLKHANPAVVIGAFRCIFIFMEYSTMDIKELLSQIIPPFISLISGSEPEIQFIVLRTLSLFVLKYPKALTKEIRIFFCKYNDPSYIKIEKLDIMLSLVNSNNVALIISELSEYCNSIDVDFVRKSIRCLGQVAMMRPDDATACVDILVKLVSGDAIYATEESIVVLSDLLRTYPGRFESAIEKICKNIEGVKDPKAKSAIVWILGEYCNLIENVDVIIDTFLDNFDSEPPEVQHQLISSFVKLYLQRPDETRDQLQWILNEATKESVLPDVRNRAITYWRLLSAENNDAAKKIVIFNKKPVKIHNDRYNEEILSQFLRGIGTVSGVLRMATTDFKTMKYMPEDLNDEEERDFTQVYSSNGFIVSLDYDDNMLYIQLENTSDSVISDFALALDKNAYGFTITSSPNFPAKLNPTERIVAKCSYSFDQNNLGPKENLSFAMKTSIGVVYFNHFTDTRRMFKRDFKMKKKEFLEFFAKGEEVIVPSNNNQIKLCDDEEMKRRNIQIVARKDDEVCLAVKFAGFVYVVDIDVTKDGLVFCIRGDKSFLNLMSKAAVYTFCEI